MTNYTMYEMTMEAMEEMTNFPTALGQDAECVAFGEEDPMAWMWEK